MKIMQIMKIAGPFLVVGTTTLGFALACQSSFARDGRSWIRAKKADTLDAYRRYESDFPEGRHIAKVRARIEEFVWRQTADAHTIRSMQTYLDTYPQGKFRDQALSEIAALRVDDKPFEAMLQKGNEHGLKEFLTEFPGHVREAEAQQVFRDIAEGKDIVHLIEANRIAVETSGSGIQSVSVRIRGFSAHEPSQNMVATAMMKVEVAGEGWTTVSVLAACANRSKRIPGKSDAFAIRRAPQQAELAALMPVLDEANVDYGIRQAAVW